MSTRPQIPGRGRPAMTAMMLLTLSTLGACGNLSGLDGGSRYACKAPEGVICDSVSGTYANALYRRLPNQHPQPVANDLAATPTPASAPSVAPQRPERAAPPAVAEPSAPNPSVHALRSQARVLRLWTQAWEDMDGDLHDQGYVYVQVSSGQWMIEHVQGQIRDAHAPLRQPPRTSETAGKPGPGMGGATETNDSTNAAPEQSSFPFPGRPAVGMPAASSFNRVQ